MSIDFYNIRNAFFYLPNADKDCIQSIIRNSKNYWDMMAHDIINKYLKDNATILDIGANIGSHTLYWAIERNAKKIYSFEPYDAVFEILNTNIKLNSLQDKVVLHNIGLSDEICNASIDSIPEANLGSIKVHKRPNGVVQLKTLDSLKIKDKINLIKIDVEGHEVEVLKGGLKTIEKSRPLLVIESFNRRAEVESVIFPMGYELIDVIREGEDYVYRCKV